MKCNPAPALACFVLAVSVPPAHTQSPAPQTPLTSRSTLVLVPALVRDKAGKLIFTLKASDFTLTDDGIPQTLHLEEDTGGEPLALVIDLEVGGAGTREFDKLGPLTPMLEAVIGNVPHTIAVVGFDSEPALVQPFTADVDTAADAVLSLTPGCTRQHHIDDCAGPNPVHDQSLGDNGAAILDSLAFSVDLLRKQPPKYRRAILLISETLDRGSHVTLEDAVRDLSDTNTAIYSIGFSTGKSEAAHYAHRQLPTQPAGDDRQAVGNPFQPGGFTFLALANHIPNPPGGCMGKDPDPDPDKFTNRFSQFYDCAGQLLPPLLLARTAFIAASDGLERNVPETVAHLTGGEYFKLTDAKSLESSLATISNHLPNRYVLSFQPQSPHPGPHALSLQLRNYADLDITARSSYWASP
jgi:VWFA-related protein